MNIAKQELKQYLNMEDAIRGLKERKLQYTTKATKTTASYSQTTSRTNTTSDKVGDNAIKLAEIDKEIDRIINEMDAIKVKLIKRINNVDPKYRGILIAVYINGKSLREYGATKNYSYSRIKHIHGDALEDYIKKNFNAEKS